MVEFSLPKRKNRLLGSNVKKKRNNLNDKTITFIYTQIITETEENNNNNNNKDTNINVLCIYLKGIFINRTTY